MSENPHAFPQLELNHDGSLFQQHAGMSLRDWFAGQALPRVIESSDMPVWAGSEHSAAERAYAFADAMLAERAKVQS
jgi:hypothetical protein